MAKKEKEDAGAKAKRRNFCDVVRDEIYGAAMKSVGREDLDCGNVVVLEKAEVKKIAKRIARRWMIGPR